MTRAAISPDHGVEISSGMILAVIAALALGGLVAIPLAAFADLPLILIPGLAIAAAGGVIALWSTQAGLCIVAFGIGPLGIVQHEILSVTINLPEALILALFCKEFLRFIAQRRPLPKNLPLLPLGVFIAVSLVGIITGLANGNPPVAVLQDWRQFTEYLVLYLLIANHVRKRVQIVQLMVAFICGSLVLALYGILQHFTGIGITGQQQVSDLVHYSGYRSGAFYGSTPLGAIMVLSLGPTLGLMLAARNRAVQAALLVAAAIFVLAAFYTNTRASWLAMGLLLAVIFVPVKKSPAMIALAVATILLFSAVLGPVVVQRLSSLKVSKSESSLLERIHHYKTAWLIFKAHPLLGLGWGCYFQETVILVNERYLPAEKLSEHTEATVHSAYLQILVRTGILGLAAFLGILADWFGRVWKVRHARKRFETDYALFIGLVASLIGYLFHSAFENFFQWPVMSQAFWLQMALSTVLAIELARRARAGMLPTEDPQAWS